MLETGLVTYLTSQSAVTALVGENIQPIPAPEELTAYPCITYQVASYIADYSSDGSTGFAQKRIVFDCWSATYLQSRQIWDALRNALTGFEGPLPDGTLVFLIQLTNGQDFFESASRLYRSSIHAVIQYSEFSTGS